MNPKRDVEEKKVSYEVLKTEICQNHLMLYVLDSQFRCSKFKTNG